MKWLLLLLWDPVEALDLKGPDGRPDHSKIIGFWTFGTILAVLGLWVIGMGELLPLGHTIALISTAYGWIGWRTFLKSKTATAHEHREERREVREETVTIKDGRDPELGIEPTP